MKHFLLPGSFCMFKFPYDDFLLFSKPENNTYVYVLERIKKFWAKGKPVCEKNDETRGSAGMPKRLCIIIQRDLQFGSGFLSSAYKNSQCWLEKTDELFRSLMATIAANRTPIGTDTSGISPVCPCMKHSIHRVCFKSFWNTGQKLFGNYNSQRNKPCEPVV